MMCMPTVVGSGRVGLCRVEFSSAVADDAFAWLLYIDMQGSSYMIFSHSMFYLRHHTI